MDLETIVQELLKGNLMICDEYREYINNKAIKILEMEVDDLSNEDLIDLKNILKIANITYNNTARDILPIEDGVYDLLVERYKNIDSEAFEPGAVPVNFSEESLNSLDRKNIELSAPFVIMQESDNKEYNSMMFKNVLDFQRPIYKEDLYARPFYFLPDSNISKRQRTTSHNHPQLVGTLDKCKFVLDTQANKAGVLGDSNIKVFESDFIAPLIQQGIIHPNEQLDMMISLKYDGVSIEADVNTEIISARTRGDTSEDKAADLTPILGGYRFPLAKKLEKPIGMKFEAIIRTPELHILNKLRGTNYINGRTAIIGLLGASDGALYRDLITLVPLQADFGDLEVSRKDEVEFLNKYYTTREYFRYINISGDYTKILYYVSRFVDEMTWSRKWIPFMYDGVVVEFTDAEIRKKLGRKGAINKFAMAIKFETLKKQTIFRGWTYTVGMDGTITPMLHYDPVEFMGAIHTKSSGNSLARFKSLDLRIGDIINVEYVNDVIPYATAIEDDRNKKNHLRPLSQAEKFITHCPSCGLPLEISSSGATASCINMNCPERTIQRLANNLNKIGIKDFSTSAIEVLGVSHFHELMTMTIDDMDELGPTNSQKFYGQLQDLIEHPLADYRMIGALGFKGAALSTWKLIFKNIYLIDFYNMYLNHQIDDLYKLVKSIKGIGELTIVSILNDWEYFLPDIKYIIESKLYIASSLSDDDNTKYIIRFTGFRDREIAEALDSYNYIDCDADGSVTKSTTYLLIPYAGYNEGNKCKKADKYGIKKIPINEFMDNIEVFIPELKNKN